MPWAFPTLREDAAGYVEGWEWGTEILYGFNQLTWLVPGMTYTRHVMTDAGTILLPYSVVPTPTGAQITDICAPGTPSTQDASILNLLIDKKVSDRFHGCFTVAGISMLEWARLVNRAKLRNMANDQKLYIAQKLAAALDSTNTVTTSTDPYSDFLTAKNEFWTKTGREPVFALVSNEYYNTLLKQNVILNLFGSAGLAQEAYVNGHVGQIAGVEIVRTGLSTALMGAQALFMDAETLHIGVPRSIAQIPNGANFAPQTMDSALEAESPSFSEGITYMIEMNAPSAIAYTWLHYFFGAMVIKDFLIGIQSTSAVTGLTGTAGDSQVVLNWTASTDTNVTGYNIYQNNVLVGTVTGASTTTYTVTGLTNGTAYNFTVVATTANGEGAVAQNISITPEAGTVTP